MSQPTEGQSSYKKVKVDLSAVLKASVQLSKIGPGDVTTIFENTSEQAFAFIECNFAYEFQENFIPLQSRLLTAQLPWLSTFTQRRLSYQGQPQYKVKPGHAKRIARSLGDLAKSPEISSQAVRDAIGYREATCVLYAAFRHTGDTFTSELRSMADKISPHEYFEGLVESSERHLASLPKPVTPSAPTCTSATALDTRSTSTVPLSTSSANNTEPFTDEYLRAKVASFIVNKKSLGNTIPWASVQDCGSNVKEELITSWYAVNDKRQAYRSTPPAILMHGDQGTGKSTLVYSFAAWKDLTLFEIGGSIHGSLRGQSEKLIEYVFDQIRITAAVKPCILFFDEVDGLMCGTDTRTTPFEGMVKSLWGRLIEDRVRCFVFGATNKPWLINMADYSRRFQFKVHLTKPTAGAREEVIKHSLSKFWHVLYDDDFKVLAAATEDYSINDIRIGVERQAAVLLRKMYESKCWTKVVKDGQEVFVPADNEINVVQGPIEHFKETEPRPITVDMLVSYFNDGNVKKTTSAEVESRHRDWNRQWNI